MRKFFTWIADELSDGIEKSTVGAIVMFASMACIIYLVFKEGGTETINDLLTMSMIVSATLMGVNSVADIFKRTDTKTVTKTSNHSKSHTKSEKCE